MPAAAQGPEANDVPQGHAAVRPRARGGVSGPSRGCPFSWARAVDTLTAPAAGREVKFPLDPDEEGTTPAEGPTGPSAATMSHGETSSSTADQRRTDRRPSEVPVRMRLETSLLPGVSDNISRAGLLFFSDEPVRVTVEVQELTGTRIYRGRLIRLQRMSETSTGLAVEFDPE